VFGAVLIPFLVSGNHAKTAVPPSAPPATGVEPAPAPAAVPPVIQPAVQTAIPMKAPSAKPGKAGGKQPRTDQAGDGRPEPKTSGKCDLTESEIPKTLDRADHYLHAGQLVQAQAQYERVVGCPAAHERAQAGLKLVKQRIDTQGSSQP
jgi:hypothetical protein